MTLMVPTGASGVVSTQFRFISLCFAWVNDAPPRFERVRRMQMRGSVVFSSAQHRRENHKAAGQLGSF